MRCQQCQAELLPGARYCHGCALEVHPLCPACNTTNPPESKFCFSCGTDLGTEFPATDQDPPQPSTVICPRCNQRNEPSSTYCYACGLPLERNSYPSSRAASYVPAFVLGKPGGFWIRLLAYLIDAVILVAVFALVWPLISGEPISDVTEPNYLV